MMRLQDDLYETKLVSVKVPKWMLKVMDDLVKINAFSNRSEIIRKGIYIILKRHLKDLREFYGEKYAIPAIPREYQ